MALLMFWIAALVCTLIATVGAIATTEPVLPEHGESHTDAAGSAA